MKISNILITTLLMTGISSAQAVEGLSANVGVTNDYMWRGATQNNHDTAVSGGLDYSSKSGFYIGTWVSNVDFGATDTTNYELDFYGGYSGNNENFSYDLGYILYAFPDADNIDLGEVYASIGWQNLTLKVSTLANSDAEGADFGDDTYIEAALSFELASDLELSLHLGSYDFKDGDTYQDYSVTLSKNDFSISLMDVSDDEVDSDVRVVVSYNLSFDL